MPAGPTTALHALLAGAIDYAGLFPPAELPLAEALANYCAYRDSPDAWALGRFVIPVARLGELIDVLRREPLTVHRFRLTAQPLRLSAVLGTAADLEVLGQFDRRLEPIARVTSVEAKVSTDTQARSVLAALAPRWTRYLEVPFGEEGEATLDAIAANGAFAKLRTGGTTPEAFPTADLLLQRLASLARRRLPFKATAGLHHPLRGSYRLSYHDDAPCGAMFGYLNLLLAAALLWSGGDVVTARAALLEEDPRAIRCEATTLQWRDTRFEAASLSTLRRKFFHSFGSCSFREPLDELAAWR